MIHKITKEQYLSDPCGVCSLAFWKNAAYPMPDNIKVVHKRDYNSDSGGGKRVEQYFRLLHRLNKLSQPKLNNAFYFQTVDIAAQKEWVARIINESYTDIKVDESEVEGWTKTAVFDKNLWLFVCEKASGLPVGLGIANYDREIGEGSLEWIQVLPSARKNGLGEAIVCELLSRLLNSGANFVTVSGKVENESRPQNLYRKCGFSGDNIWCVIIR